MKTFLLTLMLISSAAQADQWLVNGLTYKGTIHKFNSDRTLVWVTSDWDNYGGSWIKVANLDSATRVRLKVANPQEQAAVQEQQAQARAAAAQAARIEEEKLALEREKLHLLRLQEARRMNDFQLNSALNQYSSQPSASPSPQVVTSLSSVPQYRPATTPSVPYVPQVQSYQTSVPYVSAPNVRTQHAHTHHVRTPHGYTPYTPYVRTPHVYTPYVRTPHVHIPHVHVPQPIIIRIN